MFRLEIVVYVTLGEECLYTVDMAGMAGMLNSITRLDLTV